MAVVVVRNSVELQSAAKNIQYGDTIKLAAGTYESVSLNNLNLDRVTITSLDAKHPAVIESLRVYGSSGLTFTNLEFHVRQDKAASAFLVTGSSKIAFDNLFVHGSLDGNATGDKNGLVIRDSRNVTVTNSEFQQLKAGVSLLNNQSVTVSDNLFHELHTDGVASQTTSNLLIARNTFTDFQHTGDSHPDAIQLFTAGANKGAKDIVIADNVIARGIGTVMQGIFVRDESNTVSFENLKITGNQVVGMMGHGIGVWSAKNVEISNNLVVPKTGERSVIVARDATDVVMSSNTGTVEWVNSSVRSFNNRNVLPTNLMLVADIDRILGIVPLGDGAPPAVTLPTITPPIAILPPAVTEVRGTVGDDRLFAKASGESILNGGAGNDTLTGSATAKVKMIGGAGNDIYNVYSTDNTVVEAAAGGNDTVNAFIDYTLSDHVEALYMKVAGRGTGNELANRIGGSSGNDVLSGMGGDDLITAGDGNDLIYGGTGNDQLRGEGGNDTIYGDEGDDTLLGGDGDDVLFGGTGNDILEGGAGNDRLTGGAGNDFFVWRTGDVTGANAGSVDTVTDFTKGDIIHLGLIDANTDTAANDSFKFIGTGAFSKIAGQLRYEKSNGNSMVSGDLDGDGVADFRIMLLGVTSLAASDFYL